MKHMMTIAVAITFVWTTGESCNNEPQLSEADRDRYMALGDSITRMSFDTLRNTLMRAILQEGTAGAVAFCKLNAAALTATYSSSEKQVSRTSALYRNPDNKPDERSAKVLQAMQTATDKGEKILPLVSIDDQGMVHYYKPILVQAMCLNCHGSVPGQVQPDVLAVIDSLYPDDLARNYREGAFRGAWHIRFKQAAKQP
jgi:hypothetical protein